MTSRDEKLDQALAALQKGDHQQAAQICAPLIKSYPNDGEVWSFYGLAALKTDRSAGLAALEKACQIEPQEPRWFLHLGGSLRQLGDITKAEQALRRAAELSNGSPDATLPLADVLCQLGRAPDALSMLKAVSQRYAIPPVWYKLAHVASSMHDYQTAVTALKTAYQNHPIPPQDKLVLSQWYINLKDYDAAQGHVDSLMQSQPDDPDTALIAAGLATWAGELDKANHILNTASQKHPLHAGLIIDLLANSNQDNDGLVTTAIKLAEDETTGPANRRKIFFALANVSNQQKEYDMAWAYAERANALSLEGPSFDVSMLDRELENTLSIYNQCTPVTGGETPELIYLLGTPRCGGSLLQTILAAAPDVASVGERGALMPWLMPLLAQTNSAATFKSQQQDLHNADIGGLKAMNEAAKTYVDKTTHNTHVAGLIQRLHPHAKFIHMQRDPKDVAVSIFFHDFSNTFSYSRNLQDIAAYIDFHERAIKKWQEAGVSMTSHDHDTFVAAPEQKGAALFETLNISWDKEFLSVKSRNSVVRTFSTQQVRGEIKAPKTPKWERYKKHLGSIL